MPWGVQGGPWSPGAAWGGKGGYGTPAPRAPTPSPVRSPTPGSSPIASAPLEICEDGWIFHADEYSMQEIEAYHVLGAAAGSLTEIQKVLTPEANIFLINTNYPPMMYGPFKALDTPALNVVPGLFSNRLGAQVRVAPRRKPLMEVKLGWKIPPAKKTGEEVAQLLQLLRKGVPAEARIQVAWDRAVCLEPPAKRVKVTPGGGRSDDPAQRYDLNSVVVNFANVGAAYSIKVLNRDKAKGDRLYDWEGVRRCLKHVTEELRLKATGVIHENYIAPDNGTLAYIIPEDIRAMCETIEETPRVTGKRHKSADDEMTIKCAYRRNCRWLDNDNYRDWLKLLANVKIRNWLGDCQELLQMRYFFDSCIGSFDVLEGNVPKRLLAPMTVEEREKAKALEESLAVLDPSLEDVIDEPLGSPGVDDMPDFTVEEEEEVIEDLGVAPLEMEFIEEASP